MDSLSGPLVLEELNIKVVFEENSREWGNIYFGLNSDPITNVNMKEMSVLLRSAAYGYLLFGLQGVSYLEDTELKVGFKEDGRLCFEHGSSVFHESNHNFMAICKDIGRLSTYIECINSGDMTKLNVVNLYIKLF